MSDQELGKKMVEEIELGFFLEAYKGAVEEDLACDLFGRGERPDFVCKRPDGTPVGVELVKVMRDPRDAQADLILDVKEFMDGDHAMDMAYFTLLKKEKKRRQADWGLPDNTVLVLQFVDCPISDLYLDDDIKEDYETDGSHGFDEIWIADYTGLEPYGDIELFCLYPTEWWGYYERPNPGRKPYG